MDELDVTRCSSASRTSPAPVRRFIRSVPELVIILKALQGFAGKK